MTNLKKFTSVNIDRGEIAIQNVGAAIQRSSFEIVNAIAALTIILILVGAGFVFGLKATLLFLTGIGMVYIYTELRSAYPKLALILTVTVLLIL